MKKNKISLFLVITILMSILSLTIINNVKADDYETYSTYLDSKNSQSGLIYEPILVYEPTSFNELNNADSSKITEVIITPDSDMNVTLNDTIKSLKETFNTYIKGKFIPVINLNKDTVDSFISWSKQTYFISDLIVMSSDISVIDKIYKDEKLYIYNSVYDIRSKELYSNRYDNYKYVAEANKAGANIIMFNTSTKNSDVASEYFEALTKVAWGYGDTTLDLVNTISYGCYGVVSNDSNKLTIALSYFKNSGYARYQYVAAHRGITTYCNENSLSACTCAYSEGATHIEIDLQITADREIVLCHNSGTGENSNRNGWYFVNLEYNRLKEATLNDYSAQYKETYCTLSEVLEAMRYIDVIMILELKFDDGSTKALVDLECIEKLKEVLDSYPELMGHYYLITFFEPYAIKAKELLPTVPLGYIGGATSNYEKENSMTAWSHGGGHKEIYDYQNKIKFLRYYNIGLDESYVYQNSKGEYWSNITAEFYLARGYVQNTWTYESTMNFTMKTNTATTNKQEESSDLIKYISNDDLTITKEEYENKIIEGVKCYSYNGWEYDYDCEMIIISEDENNVKAILYYNETCEYPYGIYSSIVNIKIEE